MIQEPMSNIPMREYLERVMDERDRLYGSRFDASAVAVAAALASAEKAVNAAFLASEKAIIKAEEAQKDYNQRSNEFRGQLDDQAKTLMPRPETTALFKSIDEKIAAMQGNHDMKIESMRLSIEKNSLTFTSELAAIRDQLSQYVPRPEFQSAKDQAAASIKGNADRATFFITREEINALIAILTKQIENLAGEIVTLRESRSEVAGKSAGANALWGYLVAIAGIALALVFHFVK